MALNLPSDGGLVTPKTGKWTQAMWAWMRDITASVNSIVTGFVTAVTATSPITSSGGATPNISLANSGVTAATYGDATHVAQVTVSAKGLVTSAANVAITSTGVTSVTGTPPIASSGGATPAISLNDTAVTPGSYGDGTHIPTFTVDQKGRLTAASQTAVSAGTVTTTGSPTSGNLTKFSGATSITNGDLSGDVSTSGTLVTAIGANKVTDAMLRQGGATSVIGRSANSTGNEADIQSTVENHVMVRRSSVLGFTLEQSIGYWSPLTNGDPVTPELIFDSFGDTIAVWTAL